MHGHRRNNHPEVASGGLVYTQAKQEWVAFTHTDSKVRYKQVFTGMFEVGERWHVAIGAQGETDTVGVSAYTEWRDLIPPFHFVFPSAPCFDE